MSEKIIIMGSGPAGCTAALYAARANLAPLVFEGDQPGGQLTITTDVENYPGYPEGILGPQMMEEFKAQAKRFDARFEPAAIDAVDFSSHPFKITAGGATHETEAFIIASGARARLLGLESEAKLMGHGVSACATCDGFFFKDKEIAVIGGGDSAMEEATFLTKFARKVTLIHRRDELRASKIMQERAMNNPKIEFLWNKVVIEVQDVDKMTVTNLVLEDAQTGERSDFPVQGLFLAIGHIPNTHLFRDILDIDSIGYIATKEGTTHTSVEGVFACGDCVDHRYRQAVTAAGSGCMAAIDAERWIETKHA